MSQDLRTYSLERLDEADAEASEMSVTATVGPTSEKDDNRERTRGVQITLKTPNGYAYARVSENQVRDLIRVLQTRVNPDAPFESTGWKADELIVGTDGKIEGKIP